ncbi:haloalkanoic acid dehalogenase [Fomitopsis serialis]|uniref:haloalkanoic acid dehalogenase n=1 Tax=Fomitopsis serialis TaxID=139415 RepID=UPI0020072CAD|nr:haloalkanoic acid dehalogenase [Neoantrodia serialis]KAH9933726.1 haloalkanoic acid dehalogenase [Neoantrodia serialis]
MTDWESGIVRGLEPILAGTPLAPREAALTAYENVERDLQSRYPTMRYSELLTRVHAELDARAHNLSAPAEPSGSTAATVENSSGAVVEGTTVGSSASASESPDAHTAFGQSIGGWPPFPDTIAALTTLSKHFKLTVLSNVDRASFAHTQRALEGPSDAPHFRFSAVYTAEDAGAYKPDPRAREYALRRVEAELGVPREQVLVVAVSVSHDVQPSREIGLGTAWISRKGTRIGWDEAEGSKATFRFDTLGEMAEAVERETNGA